MINLNYRQTHTFSGSDIASTMGDAGLNDVTYECLTYRPEGWSELVSAFARGEGKDIDLAYEIIGGLLVSIEQSGERHLIGNKSRAIDLRDSIEAQAEGHGDTFIKSLAWAIFSQQMVVEREHLGNSERPSAALENGNRKKRERSAASK
jgi:hypothetical protein